MHNHCAKSTKKRPKCTIFPNYCAFLFVFMNINAKIKEGETNGTNESKKVTNRI